MEYRHLFETKRVVNISMVGALLLLGACSAERSAKSSVDGKTTSLPVGGASSQVMTSGTNAEASAATTAQQALCKARGQMQACYCPDGTLTGVQLCDEEGNLQSCKQCSTDTQEAPSNASGALCPDLAAAFDCTANSYVSEELPASILFVVDRSASMSCNAPPIQESEACETTPERADTNSPSKWEITIAALKEVFNKLNQSGARGGLMFFSNDDICGVNSDLALGGVPMSLIDQSQVTILSQALDRQTPLGGTPIVGATILAYKQLHQLAGGDCGSPPCGAPGNRFVVLFTDGVDSCPSPDFPGVPCGEKGAITCTQYLLDTEVKKALEANIRTYVIGAPGSENGRGFLSQLAYFGGTGKPGCDHENSSGDIGDCHFDMTTSKDFAADLSNTLLAISKSAIGSEFAVPLVEGADREKVNVQYTAPGETPICIARDDSKPCKEGANGWQFTKNPDGTPNYSKVVLCGDAYTTISNIAGVQVDVIIGCQSILIV
ncbi:MAG: VWA domain-containing protein [Deltaproteobacteria bacterium]|nr:VWA domain-containing protein [Deltaproteobacteria bacterium]